MCSQWPSLALLPLIFAATSIGFGAGPVLRLKPPLVESHSRSGDRHARAQGDASPRHAIIQFDEFPGEREIAALEEAGVTVLQYVPDNALLVLAPAQAGAGEEAPPSGLSLGEMNKVSALLLAGSEAVDAVVQAYPDVLPDELRRAAWAAGLETLDNPDMPADSFLVRGEVAALRRLGEEEGVAYIYPAAVELVQGGAAVACSGGAILMDEASGRLLPAAANLVTSFGDGWDGPGLGAASLLYWFGAMSSNLAESAVRDEILRAAAAWASVVQVSFSPAAAAKMKAEIEIFFAARVHGDNWPFDGRGGTLAHTFYPAPNTETIAGDLHFDADETWRIGADVDVYSVALHELGHALGLAHNDNPDSVMYPFYRKNAGLKRADIAEIRKLYAASNPTVQPQQPPAAPPQSPPPATDHTPPSLQITSPASSVVATSASSVNVTGSAADNIGVVEVVWSNAAGGSGKASGIQAFSTGPIPLAWGTNRITVTARDAAGNSAWRSLSVTRR
jgi:hypothetical protein